MDTEFVILNLRGKKFEVLKKTFEKFKLDKVEHRKTRENEYYISRDPKFFNLVLNFVEYDRIHCSNPNILSDVFDELAVYGFCNCTVGKSPKSCPLGHFQKLQEHKKLCMGCSYGYAYDTGSGSCNWRQ